MLTEKVKRLYGMLEEIDRKKERLIVWAFFSLLVFGVILVMGTLTSGFHLVDDWEFVKYVDWMTLEDRSLWDCLREAVGYDLTMRFRPLYYINRVLAAAVFGINLTVMSVIKGIEIIIALVALYYCARRMHCNMIYAFLFSMTVMTGYQSAVWWKLGPQESFGMMLFSVGLYLLLIWLGSGTGWCAIGSVFLFFLMSTYKESFILLLPFIMLYVVYDRMKGKKVTAAALWEAVKGELPYLLTVGLILAVELFLLVFVIGTNNYSYVGLDSQMTLDEYRSAWQLAFTHDLKWYLRFGIILWMILLTYWEQLKKLGWQMVLTLAIVLPQIVTYSKSAITERYILPVVFGFAFFFVIVGCNIKELGGKRKVVYMLCLLLMLAAHGRVTLYEANYFTYRGNSVQTMLDTTLAYTQEHPQTKVLSCLGPNLEGNKTMYYWMRVHGYDDVFYWDEDRMLISKWFGEHEDDEDILENMDVVVMYNREDRHWCYEPSLDLSDFTEQKCGTLTMYFRK